MTAAEFLKSKGYDYQVNAITLPILTSLLNEFHSIRQREYFAGLKLLNAKDELETFHIGPIPDNKIEQFEKEWRNFMTLSQSSPLIPVIQNNNTVY